jgi:hypothetical protein
VQNIWGKPWDDNSMLHAPVTILWARTLAIVGWAHGLTERRHYSIEET